MNVFILLRAEPSPAYHDFKKGIHSLKAFLGQWSGFPPLAKITFKKKSMCDQFTNLKMANYYTIKVKKLFELIELKE